MADENTPIPEDKDLDRNYARELKQDKEPKNKNGVYSRGKKAEMLKDADHLQRKSPRMDSIQTQLEGLLSPPIKTAPAYAREMASGRRLDYRSINTFTRGNNLSHKLLSPKLSNTLRTSATIELLQFQKSVTRNYMRKNLSLAYRQTITLGNIAGTLTQMGAILESKLDAIKVNTGVTATASPPEKSILEEFRDSVIGKVTKGGRRQLSKGLNKFLKTGSLNATYQDTLRDIGNRVSATSRKYNAFRGNPLNGDNFLSPIRKGLNSLSRRKINDEGTVSGIAGFAVPWLKNFKPEWFEKQHSANFLDYQKERKRPTYRLLDRWRGEQLDLLKGILHKLEECCPGGQSPNLTECDCHTPNTGRSARREKPHYGPPRPTGNLSDYGPAAQEREDREQERAGRPMEGLSKTRARMTPLAKERWDRTKREMGNLFRGGVRKIKTNPRGQALRDRVSNQIHDVMHDLRDRPVAQAWISRALKAKTLSHTDIKHFREHAREYGYASALKDYKALSHERAQKAIDRLKPHARLSKDKVEEIKARATEHGATAALAHYSNLLRHSNTVQSMGDRTNTVIRGARDGSRAIVRRARDRAEESKRLDALRERATQAGDHRYARRLKSMADRVRAVGPKAAAGGGLLSGIRRLFPDKSPVNDNPAPINTSPPHEGDGWLKHILGDMSLGAIEGIGAAGATAGGVTALLKKGGIRAVLKEAALGALKAPFKLPWHIAKNTAKAAWWSLKRLPTIFKYGWDTLRGKTLPGKALSWTTKNLWNASTWLPRKIIGGLAGGLSKFPRWAARGIWNSDPKIAKRGSIARGLRAAPGWLLGSMGLDYLQNHVDSWAPHLGLQNHTQGLHAMLNGGEWAMTAAPFLGRLGGWGKIGVGAAGLAGYLHSMFPQTAHHIERNLLPDVLWGAGAKAATKWGLNRFAPAFAKTKWGKRVSLAAAVAPILYHNLFGTSRAADIAPIPKTDALVPISTAGSKVSHITGDIDSREQMTGIGAGIEYGKISATDFLLVQATLGILKRGKKVAVHYLGEDGYNRLRQVAPRALAGDPTARAEVLGMASKAHLKASLGENFGLRDFTATPSKTAITALYRPKVILGHLGTGLQLGAGVGADIFNRQVTDRYINRLNADGTRNSTNQAVSSAVGGLGNAISFGSTGSMFGKRGREIGMALGGLYGAGETNPSDLIRSGTLVGSVYMISKKLGVSPVVARRLALLGGIGGALPGLTHTDTNRVDTETGQVSKTSDSSTWGDLVSAAGLSTAMSYVAKTGKNIWTEKNWMPALGNLRQLPRMAVGGVAGAGGIAADLLNNRLIDRLVPKTRKDGKSNLWNKVVRTAVSVTGNAIAYGEMGGSLGGPYGLAAGILGGATYGYFHENPQQLKSIISGVTNLVHLKLNKAKRDLRNSDTASSSRLPTGVPGIARTPNKYMQGVSQGRDNSDITQDPSYKMAYSYLTVANKKRMDGSRALQFLLYSYAITNTPKHAAMIINQRVSNKENDSDIIKDITAYRALKDSPNNDDDRNNYVSNVFDQEQTAQSLLNNPNSMSGYQERVAAGGIGLVSMPPPPKGEQMSLARTAVDIFTQAGYSQISAVSMAGNDMRESQMNRGAVGDGGLAYGICQWHPDRRKMIEMQFKKPMSDMSFSEQCQAQIWEIKNNPKGVCPGAQSGLMGAKSIEDAVGVLVDNFERPADRATEKAVRIKLSKDIWNALYDKNGKPDTNAPAPASDTNEIGTKPANNNTPTIPPASNSNVIASGTNGGSSVPPALKPTPNLSAAANIAKVQANTEAVNTSVKARTSASVAATTASMNKAVAEVGRVMREQYLADLKKKEAAQSAGGQTTAAGGPAPIPAGNSRNNKPNAPNAVQNGPTLSPTNIGNIINQAAQTHHHHHQNADQVSTRRDFKTS